MRIVTSGSFARRGGVANRVVGLEVQARTASVTNLGRTSLENEVEISPIQPTGATKERPSGAK